MAPFCSITLSTHKGECLFGSGGRGLKGTSTYVAIKSEPVCGDVGNDKACY